MSTIQSKHGGARVRFPPPLVFLGFILVGLAIHYTVWPLTAPIGRTVRLVAGGIVGLVGLALNVTTNVLFRRSGQSPVPWKPSPSMILQGPYRFSRNPMYLSVTLIQAGIGLALNDLWIILFCVPALIIVHYTAVLPEEAYLTEQFGEKYERYKVTVRRYL